MRLTTTKTRPNGLIMSNSRAVPSNIEEPNDDVTADADRCEAFDIVASELP
jgi:hypothetical protein